MQQPEFPESDYDDDTLVTPHDARWPTNWQERRRLQQRQRQERLQSRRDEIRRMRNEEFVPRAKTPPAGLHHGGMAAAQDRDDVLHLKSITETPRVAAIKARGREGESWKEVVERDGRRRSEWTKGDHHRYNVRLLYAAVRDQLAFRYRMDMTEGRYVTIVMLANAYWARTNATSFMARSGLLATGYPVGREGEIVPGTGLPFTVPWPDVVAYAPAIMDTPHDAEYDKSYVTSDSLPNLNADFWQAWDGSTAMRDAYLLGLMYLETGAQLDKLPPPGASEDVTRIWSMYQPENGQRRPIPVVQEPVPSINALRKDSTENWYEQPASDRPSAEVIRGSHDLEAEYGAVLRDRAPGNGWRVHSDPQFVQGGVRRERKIYVKTVWASAYPPGTPYPPPQGTPPPNVIYQWGPHKEQSGVVDYVAVPSFEVYIPEELFYSIPYPKKPDGAETEEA